MNEIKDILQDIKFYYKKDPNNIPKQIKDNEQKILNVKINEEDKFKVLNLIFKYETYKYQPKLFNDIIKEFKLQDLINSKKEFNYYDKIIHKFIYTKIKSYKCSWSSPSKVNDIIENETNLKIKKQLEFINIFIDKYEFIDKIQNECKIITLTNNEIKQIKNNLINYEKIIKDVNKPYFLKQTIYYDDNETLNSYQCYFKAAINFFLNCEQFINQFYSNNLLEEQELNQKSPNLCQTDSLTGGTNIIYILFNKMFNENEKNNDIDVDYYLQLKDIINVNLDNKYQLEIPGYKIYSFYVIQDILKLLEDTFFYNVLLNIKNLINQKLLILIFMIVLKVVLQNMLQNYIQVMLIKILNWIILNIKILKNTIKKVNNLYVMKMHML